MKHLLIVYHSKTGNTERLAQAVIEGARDEAVQGVEVRVRLARQADAEDLLWAHALLLGTPENFGYMSGALKDFFDRTFYPAEPYQLSKPYALFVSAGNDGTGAVNAVERICKGYPLKPVAEAVIVKGDVTEEGLQRCHELGQTIAAAVGMGAI